jgi:hypothetical protein
MFLIFKLSFVVNILAFFWLGNILGYSLKNLAIFYKSSGLPKCRRYKTYPSVENNLNVYF